MAEQKFLTGIYEAPFGFLCLKMDSDGFLLSITLREQPLCFDWEGGKSNSFKPLADLKKQLSEYFNRKRKVFSVPLRLYGTVFQKRIWNFLLKIPYGEFCTYKNLACNADSLKGARAAGNAVGANPIPVIIPCHRVIPSSGGVGNYNAGADIKKMLLDLEGIVC